MIWNLLRIWKETGLNLQRNFLMSLATVSTVFISTLVLGLFLLTSLNLNFWTRKVIDQLQIVVYFKEGIKESEFPILYKILQDDPRIKEVEFISKEEAFKRLKAKLSGKVNLEYLPENPLPNTFEIKLKDIGKVKEVAESLEKVEGVSRVKYGKMIAERLIALSQVVSVSGGIMVFLSFLCTFFIVLNTIRLTIIAREEEIKIMTLVGASPWFIRGPFILEGMIQGLLGGLPALFLIYLSYWLLVPHLGKILPFLSLLPAWEVFLPTALILIFTGLGVGALAAFISVNRHLAYR